MTKGLVKSIEDKRVLVPLIVRANLYGDGKVMILNQWKLTLYYFLQNVIV